MFEVIFARFLAGVLIVGFIETIGDM